VEDNIDPASSERNITGTVISMGSPRLEGFGVIRPDHKGEATDPLGFSSDLRMTYEVIVERTSLIGGLGTLQSLMSGGPFRSKEKTTAIVELIAQVSPDYSQLKLDTVKLRD
jgi:hypothetical protein